MPTIDQILKQGWQVHQAGDPQRAEQVYRHVLAHAPKSADALVYLGIALFDQRRFDDSVEAYREALQRRGHFPVCWNNLGNALRMLGEIDEAEEAFEIALRQQPGYLSALKNRGTLWIWSGEIERGLRWYEKGLAVDPQNAELHRNLGVIYLLLGDYNVGWREYRWRWAMPGTYRPLTTAPIWQGEEVRGKAILLYPEQGRGDAIQFIRVAEVLRHAGATVYVQCASDMMTLFSATPGIAMLLPEGAVTPPIDYHASLMDVVDRWYGRTGELPYAGELFSSSDGYLTVTPSHQATWKQWLDLHAGSARRIGINWQGNPEHHADVYRSVPLQTLTPLAGIAGTALVSLQFGFGAEQIAASDFAERIVLLPATIDRQLGAFTDTAAVLKNLDLVITTDTAIAHLAGALAVPVLLMLGRVPDWRWLTMGDTTPWYPTMRLVRQTQLGDWTDVIRQVVSQATTLLESGCHADQSSAS